MMDTVMWGVLKEVVGERARQIVKWGGPEKDGVENPNQSNYIRLRTLAEEFGEVAEAMGRPEDGNGKRNLRKELLQVAAVAVAWVEGLDAAAAMPWVATVRCAEDGCDWERRFRTATGEERDDRAHALLDEHEVVAHSLPCPACGGDRYVTESAHGCGGDENRCADVCPVPEQAPCEPCGATGRVPC